MTTFSLPNPNILLSGQWANTFAGGHDAAQMLGLNGRLDTVIAGTDLSLKGLVGFGSLLEASVDGGPFSQLSPVYGAWAPLAIFIGLPEAAHSVTVRHAGGNRDWYLDRAEALEVTGSVPALQSPGGFGAMTVLNSPSIRAGGGWLPMAVAGYENPPCLVSQFPDATFHFRSDAVGLSLWTFQNGHRYRLSRDGVEIADVADTGGGRWDWLAIANGLDGAAHDYALWISYCGADTAYAHSVMTIGGEVLSASFPAKRRVAFLGDSITRGDTLNGEASDWVHILSSRLCLEAFNLGRNGSTVVSHAAGDFAGDTPERVAEVVACAPDECVIAYGVVDMLNGTGAADFEAAYRDMIARIRAASPAARLHCLGIQANTRNTPVARAEFDLAIQSSVSGVSNLFYHDTETWLNISTDLADGLHPNAEGHAKIADKAEGYLRRIIDCAPAHLRSGRRRGRAYGAIGRVIASGI
jgi:lysophospholipase L1-like esterase